MSDGRCRKGARHYDKGLLEVTSMSPLCRSQSTSEEDATFFWVYSLPFLFMSKPSSSSKVLRVLLRELKLVANDFGSEYYEGYFIGV